VGGKLLTNYLKEILSFRQWNVQDESVVINELKEALCYCSTDFTAEMRKYHHQRSARKQWILPDFVHHFKGRLRDENEGIRAGDDEQALEMGLEMISVPEVLFNPSDIGLNQAGIPEAIFQAVSSCPREIQPALYQNILLAGGNTKYPNFKTRLYVMLL
jgi:actin-related protein 6